MGCCSTKQHVNNPSARPGVAGGDASNIQSNAPVPKPTPGQMNGQVNKQSGLDNPKMQQQQRIDTPQLTEDNNMKSPSKVNDPNAANGNQQFLVDGTQQHLMVGGKPKSYQYFDISPKVIKKYKIYHISNTFPVSRPYSNNSDWQNVLSKQQNMVEEEFIAKILQIRNRNWIQDQIKLQLEQNNQSAGSLDSLLISRRIIQLREQFNWFIWAIAQYYFAQKIENKFNLPKINAKKWIEGFEYKGVYIRVLPHDEAYYLHNEILALKYVQIELLELNSLSVSLNQQYGSIKEHLHKDVLLPLIAGVSCGGFYLYGSPIIYTQELDQTKEFYKDTLNGSKMAALHQSVHNSVQMQAIQNQSNLSFSYLHNNISPDFVQDSLFKFMPILKNITSKNMIPIIDFEEYNGASGLNDSHKGADIELKYLLVQLFDVLPRLSETSASTILMRYPCFINEEITFHKFPKNNFMEFRELRRMISSESENDLNDEDDDIQMNREANGDMFSKKFFSKHGWDFILMYKKGVTSENKRATNFYMQREIPLRKTPQQAQQDAGNNNMLFIEEYAPKDENPGDQQRIISPHKQSILKRSESIQEENKIYGNVLVAAYNYKKDFKLQYSMNNHTFSTNIESLFSASVDQVVKVIESSDNMYNSNSLKELFHRKGLNLRFQWVVLAKLRVNTQRELVMIDILLRTMRRIINEEIKLKSKVQQHTQVASSGGDGNAQGATLVDEYYQGNQIDVYKDTLTFYMNTLLKRKLYKHKQVFDETLLGLFLSRMSILGIVHSLNLKKEEFFYLESKDILEDIIEAPSKNPAMFINAVQTYFRLDFKPDFLRLLRQDKLLFLSKSAPLSKSDIKQLQFKVATYFTIREQAYFMLARQITNNSRGGQGQKLPGKIKTKTDKDKLKSSFQKPPRQSVDPSNRGEHTGGIGPQSFTQNSSMIAGGGNDYQDSNKTQRAIQNDLGNKESLSTIRQYLNMDKAIINDSQDFSSPPLNQAKLQKLDQPPLDFSKLSKRTSFKPSTISEIILPSILYKLKTFLSNNPMYYFDDTSKIYVGDTFTVLKSFYEVPNLDLVDEWTIVMESLLKDVYSVNGHEQVLLEALVYQAMLIYFFKSDSDELFKILAKIRDALFTTTYCSPETLIMIQILTGLYFEDKRDQMPMEAEKSYLTAMICIFQLYGDPRGRGNFTMPYTLYLAWKLSLLSLAEDKKLHDSEFAEEIFDASLRCLFNHKKHYKDQQLILGGPVSNKGNIRQAAEAGDLGESLQKSKFEQELDKYEIQLKLFDIKKFKNKPFNITFASGLPKSNTMIQKRQQQQQQQQQAMNVYISSNHNFSNSKPEKKVSAVEEEKIPAVANAQGKVKGDKSKDPKKDSIKSKSHIPRLNKRTSKQQNEYDLDPSDIDLDIEDENKNFFVDENFKNNEWYIGMCPFQHWSLYRYQISQILQAHHNTLAKNFQAQSQYQREIYREMLQKFLPRDLFYAWLVKFNPVMYQSGVQWSSQTIKEVIFCQNQQMVSSSSSSVVLSHHNMSHQSLSSTPSSAKEKRNMHLGSYSQILGKEVGGICKQDMNGVLFTMGTDAYGQLGLDVITTPDAQNVSLRVLYPRMVVQLRDEIIKEICCGHSHTLIINVNGQVYSWGLNESGQLGLGPDAPPLMRRPVMNPYLQSVTKLSAGNEHSLAITKNGELYIWGGGGLTGLDDLNIVTVPTKMEFFNKTKITTAVCGGLHTIAVTREGEIYSWGSTEGGQLGLSQQTIMQLCKGKEEPVTTPQKIPKLEGVFIAQVACGEAHTIAMSKEGQLFGWGMSNYGQLGLGFSSDSFEPGIGMEKSKVHEPQEIQSAHLKQERISKIICGATFSLFQTEKGDLYGCGMNDLGQLGLDTFMEDLQIASLEKAKRGKHHQTSDVTVPTKVICFQGIALHNIACGENHALAVSGDDKNMLWAWGMYKQGQLGLGEVTMKMNPRPVQTLCSSFINRIACGSAHSVALIGDSSQISTLSSQYYANNDVLMNNWQCDIRGLGNRDNDDDDGQNQGRDGIDEYIPDDGEGKVKNPK